MITKGNWTKSGLLITQIERNVLIADCRQGTNLNEMDANAQLIAAAPAMYEALKELMQAIDNGYELIGADRESRIKQALNLAEGK